MVSIRSMMFALAAAPIMVAGGVAWAEAPYGAVDHTATEAEQTIHVRVTRPGESAVSKTLEIDINKTAILEFEQDVDDILVANPGIADVLARSKRRIAVMGRGKGESGIIFLDKNGNEVLSLDVIVAAQGVTELQGLINRLVPESSIHAEFVNGAIVLTGQAKSLADADTAIQLSQQFVEKNNPVLNMVSIEGKDQVLLKVRIVEMQRSVVKQLGVNLSGNLNVGEFASQTVGQIFDAAGLPLYDEAGNLLEGLVSAPPWDQTTSIATANTFGLSGGSLGGLSGSTSYQNYVGGQLQSSAGVTLDALERVGLLRTLAEPNLTALSGENAKFLAGGEFPVPNGTDDEGNISLAFKPFGVGLGFTPVVLSAGRISMRISTEVSEMTNEGGFQAGRSGRRRFQRQHLYDACDRGAGRHHAPRRHDCRTAVRRIAGRGWFDQGRNASGDGFNPGRRQHADPRRIVPLARIPERRDGTRGHRDALSRRADRSQQAEGAG